MKNIKYNKIQNKEKGVAALFITMMVMLVSLSMVLGLTAIFVSYIRVIEGMGDSVVAFYAANSGIERLLYLRDKLRQDITSIDGTLINEAATYNVRHSIVGGREHFESIGIFKEARRSIRITR